MAARAPKVCVSEGNWSTDRRGCKPTKTKPLRFSKPNIHFNQNTTTFTPNSFQGEITLQQQSPDHSLGSSSPPTYAQHDPVADMDALDTSFEPNPGVVSRLSPESVKHATGPNSPIELITVSPQDTWTNASFMNPDLSFGADGQAHMVPVMEYNGFPDTPDLGPLMSKPRRDSVQTGGGERPSTKKRLSTGRKRKAENIEPDSARAIYLEKNRQAASKCRGKQKKQEEELVETARNMERRNRVLKAEVEMLRGSMRDLMDSVGQHANCPDSRLMIYVQREADKLASRGVPSPFSESTPSKTSLSPERSHS